MCLSFELVTQLNILVRKLQSFVPCVSTQETIAYQYVNPKPLCTSLLKSLRLTMTLNSQ